MSNIFILSRTIPGGRFSIGKAKYIVNPQLPHGDGAAVAQTLQSWMVDKVPITIK
jgi:hypothetical protein